VNRIRSTVCVVLGLALLLSAAAVASAAEPTPSPIPNLQDPGPAPSYLGTPAVADPVQPPSAYRPALTFMHGNAGNTGSLNFPGPLGIDPTVGSAVTTSSSPFMWGKDGTLTTGCRVTVESVAYSCLAAVEPKTLTTEARWLAPPGQTARGAYIVMNAETKQIYVPTTQGKIFVVQREDGAAGPTFSTLREIDLSSVLLTGESPLVVMPDTRGDIWFATGAILGAGETSAPNMTYGFVTPDGSIHTAKIAGQIDENGAAVDGTDFYLDTGPENSSETTDKPGYMLAVTSNSANTAVETVWKETYDAGTKLKPGGFARGSGSSVTLIGDEYLAITDNATEQTSALIYKRAPDPLGGSQLVCRQSIYAPGASAVDIAGVTEQNGSTSSVVLANDYNAPAIIRTPEGFQGAANDKQQMAPGYTRVDVNPSGHGCHIAWEDPVRITTVPVMSTQTGLIYAYEEDEALAEIGLYAFYFEAIDYRTGDVVWRRLAGAGGYKNDNYSPMALGPDGTLYQGTSLGTVWMRDNPPAKEAAGPAAAPTGASSGSSSTPTPAPARTCTVPKLKGRTLRASKRKIRDADCTVGKVTKKKGAKAKTGKVVGQGRRAGTVLPAGASVKLTLGRG
jgi:PASTA domain